MQSPSFGEGGGAPLRLFLYTLNIIAKRRYFVKSLMVISLMRFADD
jgi:hypothetical protein